MAWQAPSLQVKWGPWFTPDHEDQAKVVKLTNEALTGQIITKRIAVEKIAAIFNIENPDAVLKELESEQQAADDRQIDVANRELEAAAKFASPGKAPAANGGSKPAAAKPA